MTHSQSPETPSSSESLDLGRIRLDGARDVHAVVAGLGLVVAQCGVGMAIWFTGQVLVPRLTTPKTMKKMKKSRALAELRAQIDRRQRHGQWRTLT
jgi:hypothetical protein